jgi:hypothetical protein
MSLWPDDLFDFAFISDMDDRLDALVDLSEKEEWDYQNTETVKNHPILYNYLHYTYAKLAEEEKIELSADGSNTAFNTGLVTPNQEPIFALFDRNSIPDRQPWFLKKWCRKGEHDLVRFQSLPEMAHYFSNPVSLVFDTTKDLRANVEHIIADNKNRFPPPYDTMNDYALQTFLKGAIDQGCSTLSRRVD